MFKKDPMFLLFDETAPTAPAMQPEAPQTGMLETVKEKLNVNNIMEKIKSSKDQLFEIGLYAGAGFLSGFLLKKYSSYVAVLVLLLVGLGVLHQMEVIHLSVNWDKANEIFGINAVPTVSADSLIHTIWAWIRANLTISVSFLVGLFIGLKVG